MPADRKSFFNSPTKKHNPDDDKDYLVIAHKIDAAFPISHIHEITGKADAQLFKDGLIAKGYTVIAFEINGKL